MNAMAISYDEWIAQHVSDHVSAYGRCAAVTLAMQAAFPELRRVRGHYYCMIWGERQHWWLVTPAGEIVDPTARQFPSGGSGVYEPWPEGAAEPTGKCPNCGEFVYDRGTVCSDACAGEYAAYCLRG